MRALRGVVFAFAALALLSPIGAQNQDARVKTMPQGKYPMIASWLGVEGFCQVRFSVDEDGYPFAVTPSCTRKIFCFDAKRAVSAATFSPKLIDGVPSIRTDVYFPMEYFFEGSDYSVKTDPRPLELCEERAIS